NVFSEKPLVQNSQTDDQRTAKELVGLAQEHRKILTMNTQWPSIIERIEEHIELAPLTSFSMYTQPESFGRDMLTEQLSHSSSILVKLIPNGVAADIAISQISDEVIDIY